MHTRNHIAWDKLSNLLIGSKFLSLDRFYGQYFIIELRGQRYVSLYINLPWMIWHTNQLILGSSDPIFADGGATAAPSAVKEVANLGIAVTAEWKTMTNFEICFDSGRTLTFFQDCLDGDFVARVGFGVKEQSFAIDFRTEALVEKGLEGLYCSEANWADHLGGVD